MSIYLIEQWNYQIAEAEAEMRSHRENALDVSYDSCMVYSSAHIEVVHNENPDIIVWNTIS